MADRPRLESSESTEDFGRLRQRGARSSPRAGNPAPEYGEPNVPEPNRWMKPTTGPEYPVSDISVDWDANRGTAIGRKAQLEMDMECYRAPQAQDVPIDPERHPQPGRNRPEIPSPTGRGPDTGRATPELEEEDEHHRPGITTPELDRRAPQPGRNRPEIERKDRPRGPDRQGR